MAGVDEVEQTPQAPEQTPQAPGFGERGRMRRRARFLRKARELAYRDLGGLVFDLHRFGQRNDQLVLAKLAALRQIDKELRELEQALRDCRPVTVLREAGIAACPRCAAIHGSDDRFCPGCGFAFDSNADRPISTAPMSVQAPVAAPAAGQTPVSEQTPAAAQTPVPAQTPAATQSPAAAQTQVPAQTPVIARAPAAGRTPAAAQTPVPAQTPAAQAPVPARAPVAAQTPAAASSVMGRVVPERKEPERPEEDEPTQILRPPATGT